MTELETGKLSLGRPRVISGRRYASSGYALLRTPVLPYEAYTNWSSGLQAVSSLLSEHGMIGDGPELIETLTKTLSSDLEKLRRVLVDTLARPEIRESIFIASPDLHENLDEYLESPDKPGLATIELAFVRYFQRMTCRAMPFGLFSGCTFIKLGERTDIVLSRQADYRRETRLDMDFLSRVLKTMTDDGTIRPEIRHFPNNSIYSIGGFVRYAESRIDETGRSHHLISVHLDEFVELVLDFAGPGRRPGEIAGMLVERYDELEREDADAFVAEIIDSQLLVPEIQIPITGLNALDEIRDRLSVIPAAAGYHRILGRAQRELREIDGTGCGNDISRYERLADGLDELPVKVNQKSLIQVDMWKPSQENLLDAGVAHKVLECLEFLNGIFPFPGKRNFSEFRNTFVKRYEAREVPLAELLDDDWGLGFRRSEVPSSDGSPLLTGLPISSLQEKERPRWEHLYNILLRIRDQALRNNEQVVDLDVDDFRSVRSVSPPHLPDSFSSTVSIGVGESGEQAIVFESTVGPSSARMLGRFCYLDQELTEAVKKDLRHEEGHNPAAIYAEIVHLPKGRTGNIIFRPVLRDYEIAYLAKSGVDADHVITVDDLTVSVRQNRIVLKSRRLGREVIPRMATAHVYWSRTMAVYQFLGLLQNQEHDLMPFWHWGPLENSGFLPRIRLNGLTLARARWRLGRTTIDALLGDDPVTGFINVQRIRRKLGWPRRIQVLESDHIMIVDLDNVLSVGVFLKIISHHGFVIVEEFHPDGGNYPVQGDEGSFCNQFVIPFARLHDDGDRPETGTGKASGHVPARPLDLSDAGGDRRTIHPPGSNWLYLKIFCGSANADRILSDAIGPAAEEIVSSGFADTWFFIRYGDPDWHLRLRFSGDPKKLLSDVLPLLNRKLEPYLDDGSIWNIQMDSYMPEIERYGGPLGMAASERLFQADSRAVANVLQLVSGDIAAELSWMLAFMGVDGLLNDLGFSIREKHEIMNTSRQTFWDEFSGSKGLRKAMGLKYRMYRPYLQYLLAGDDAEPPVESPGDADATPLNAALVAGRREFGKRSLESKQAVDELRSLEKEGHLKQPMSYLAVTLSHMHCNRMLRSFARAHELVIYDFLCREYLSSLAREKKKGGK